MTQTLARPVPLLGPNPTIDEWLAGRRTGIGGSDVAAILGISRYAGPTRVYYDKLGVLPDEDNAKMEWGRRHEQSIRQKFADEHPELHVCDGPGLVSHPERRWQLATVDGLILDAPGGEPVEIFEAKTATPHSNDGEWGDEATDEVPLPYVCQCTWYMDIYGVRRARLAVLINGWDYREYVIDYDPELARKLREHASILWHRNILMLVPPSADGLDSTAEVLAAQHNPVPKSKAELGSDALGWARIYGNAHQDEVSAKARKAEAGNHLRAAFLAAGSPHEGQVGGRKVASFSKKPAGVEFAFDLDRFAAEQPDLHSKYLIPQEVAASSRLPVAKEFM